MIFVLIPVFNRLAHTERVVDALRRQTLASQLCIVIINDGSTDGTATYLAQQSDVVELRGDGNLWWGGAIQLGLKYVMTKREAGDYVLFLNNDTWFGEHYIETLVKLSAGDAAVGSAIHEADKNPPLVSIGPKVDIGRQTVWDLLSELPDSERRSPKTVYRVDALSGRGTLYPVILFERYGCMRPRLLPHYLGDYEIAMRFKRAGVPLLVSTEAFVYSPAVYGNDITGMSLWQRLFSQRSSSNVIRRLVFYTLVGSPLQRAFAPLKMAYIAIHDRLIRFAHKVVQSRSHIQ
jgi:GT2 family glycosyltransferase